MSKTFSQLGLPKAIVRSLAERGIHEPFPIQAATIPDVLDDRDVCGRAPTGSGKTLAFGLPVLATIAKASRHRPSALILAPTRELAEQIKVELMPSGKAMGRFVAAVYGGVGYGGQKAALRRGVDMLVATPGRLEDLLEQGVVDLGDVEAVVIDEADRMADMGFLPAVRRILDQTPADRQTLLFSATLDGDVGVLVRDYQREPVRHQADAVDTGALDARHHFWLVQHEDRVRHTADIVGAAGRSIIFTRTRRGADRLARQLERSGVKAVAMHGGRSQNQRQRALKSFAAGKTPALVATDVAARGIHIDAVESVVHFDLPADHKDYLHRSGRTARAGASGIVVSLVTSGQQRDVSRMQRQVGLDAPVEAPRIDALEEGGYELREPETSRGVAPDRSTGKRQGERSARSNRARTGSSARREGGNRDEVPNAPDRGRSRDASPRDASGGSQRPTGRRQTQSVYIANIPWSATEADLAHLCRRFGKVEQATIVTDRKTGRSRGFAFVDMAPEGAVRAVEQLQGASMGGRPLTVRAARPQRPKAQTRR
jgi:superfamily II DNA/RNA helicase